MKRKPSPKPRAKPKTLAQRVMALSALWVDSPHEDVRGKIAGQLNSVTVMRRALVKAAAAFDAYAVGHDRKATLNTKAKPSYAANHRYKAEENRKMADLCRAALR